MAQNANIVTYPQKIIVAPGTQKVQVLGTGFGPTGAQGPQGIQGETGATGPQGEPGGFLNASATAPTSPSTGDLWYETVTGYTWLYDGTNWVELAGTIGNLFVDQDAEIDGTLTANHIHGNIAGSVYLHVKNTSGVTIPAGSPVYATGSVGSSGATEVAISDADNASTMPALGIVAEELIQNAEGHATILGVAKGLDTSTWSINDNLYVSTTGALTNARPTGSSELVQKIGRVIRVDASTGEILVLGAGRTNDVPNGLSPTITLAGDASGSVTLTDLGSGTLTVTVNDDSHNHSTYLPLSGGTLNGNLNLNGYTISGNGSGLTSLNASNISSGTFPDRFSSSTRYNIGYIDGVSGSSYDKLRVYNDGSYSIGMVSGISYGHLNDWAMTFRMNNDTDRGFWWGDTSDSASQGAMSLTTYGRLTVAQSLSVGQGNSITSPSTATLYVAGSMEMTGGISASNGNAYFNSVYLPDGGVIYWSNGDTLGYDDGSNQFTFSGDGDTNIVNDGHLIFDSGIVLSNSDANYGSAELDGYTRGSYYGLNLNNGANFMSNGTAMGIYNDTDNEWIVYGNRNSDSFLFHNGGIRVTCRSDGVTNAGRIITDGIAYNHSNCGGTANSMALRWVNPYIKGSVDNVVCATLGTVSDERFKRDIESWDGGIDILRQLRTVTYTPRDITAWGEVSMEPIEGYEPREPKHGLIAQEVIQVMPTAVDGASTDSGYLSLNEDELIAMLISAVQNIDSRLTALGA